MVADDDAAAFGGDVVAAFDFEIEEDVEDGPAAEADGGAEEVAEEDVEAGKDADHAAGEEDHFAGPVELVVEEPEEAGGEDDAEHVGEVVGGEDAALFGGGGFVLQEGVERHDEEAAEEAHEREPDEGPGFGGDGAQGHAGEAHEDAGGGDEAEFDAFAGDAAAGHGAGADADGEGGDEEADLRFAAVEGVVDEDDEGELDEAADEPEEADAGDGEGHGLVFGEDLEAFDDFREGVPVERFGGGGGFDFGDAQGDEGA